MIFNSIDQEIKRLEDFTGREPQEDDNPNQLINTITLETLKKARQVIAGELENINISDIMGTKDQVIRLLITQNKRLKNKNTTLKNRVNTLLDRLSFIRNKKEA